METNQYKNIKLTRENRRSNCVTHSGKFHVDDVISTIFLSKLKKEVILEKIEKCTKSYLIFETEMPYRKAMKYNKNENVKYIIFKSRREGYDIRTLIDCCKFKNEITQATDINISRKLTKIDDLIYVDVHGKLCCTKTLESAIKLVKYYIISKY